MNLENLSVLNAEERKGWGTQKAKYNGIETYIDINDILVQNNPEVKK